eukprot:c3328_g1_i1.p1 GENE.c3328_g1_i1~~c3328_g1_i1.p1  ORF type:complete len:101 (-),score=18.11 c3328_g1_i1:105-386(-)
MEAKAGKSDPTTMLEILGKEALVLKEIHKQIALECSRLQIEEQILENLLARTPQDETSETPQWRSLEELIATLTQVSESQSQSQQHNEFMSAS